MADASVGEPLVGRHQACLYSAQVAQGTAVTPATSAGIVNFEMTSDADLRSIFNIGSPNAKFNKPGINRVNFSISNVAVQTKAILERAVRASGVLPWTTFGFGYDDDASTNYAFQVQDCKVGQLDLALDAGGLLTATLAGTGGLITDLSTFTMAHLAQTPMMSYEGVFTKGGAAYILRNFRMSVNHNLSVDPVIAGAAPSTFKRGWKYITEGNEAITGEVTRFAKSSANLQANTLTDFAMVLTCTDIVGGMSPTTITITLTDAQWGSERYAGEIDGVATFTTQFIAKSFTIA